MTIRSTERRVRLALFAAALVASPGAAAAQAPAAPPRWEAGLALGYGTVEITSREGRGGGRGALAMDFRIARALARGTRVSVELGGWAMEYANIWDPAKGESVSGLSVGLQVTPVRAWPLFVEAGAGLITYTNHHPLEFGSDGTGWRAAVGYEVALPASFVLVPSVQRSGGRLRDIRNALVSETGLGYSVTSVRVALLRRWGR
ncbi:MAG: hypothetical protein OEW77_05930 [Gemmatimonadota bacterium]|nr:hypothetical protein [Gemmatimonadota bacterium]